jgi:hypothetical protein
MNWIQRAFRDRIDLEEKLNSTKEFSDQIRLQLLYTLEFLPILELWFYAQ